MLIFSCQHSFTSMEQTWPEVLGVGCSCPRREYTDLWDSAVRSQSTRGLLVGGAACKRLQHGTAMHLCKRSGSSKFFRSSYMNVFPLGQEAAFGTVE